MRITMVNKRTNDRRLVNTDLINRAFGARFRPSDLVSGCKFSTKSVTKVAVRLTVVLKSTP